MTYLSFSNDRPRSEASAGGHAVRRYQAKISALFFELQPLIIGLVVFASTFVAKKIYFWLDFNSGDISGSITGIAVVVGIATSALTFRGSIQAHADRKLEVVLTEYGLRLSAVFIAILASVSLLAIHDRYPPAFICIWYAASLAVIGIDLYFLGRWERRLAAAGLLVERVAIYGSKHLADNIARLLASESQSKALAAFFTDEPAFSVGGLPNNGGLSELLELARSNECDRIIIALPLSDSERIQKVVTTLEAVPTPIQFCLSTEPLPFDACGFETLDSNLLMNVRQHPLGTRGEIFKSVMDFGLTLVAIVLFSPLMLLIAIIIKYDSPGPVFFIQRRGGYRGRCVKVFKFRTMKVLEDGPVVQQAKRNDDRITRVGPFLRRTSLDELPQLFNVLRGELSLVGPRPHALAHDEYYGKLVERYAARH